MKREGRQHGLVATCPILLPPQQKPSSRKNKFDRPPIAGNFTKVSQKPTNHSKYTSRCSRPGCASCHICPASKAKDKTKGTHKLRSSDVVTNYRLLTWRVVDARSPRFHFSGFSASGILDRLDYYEDDDMINDGEAYESTHPIDEEIGDSPSPTGGGGDGDHNNSMEEDGEMSNTNLGIVDGEDEEEGWCLVQGL